MSERKRDKDVDDPRGFKHLAIHVLAKEGFMIFNNVGPRKTIDHIVGMPVKGEYRTAAIRFKTSSFNIRIDKKGKIKRG